MLLWHLRELGGVRKNDNHFVSVKELSQDTENSSAWHLHKPWKHKGKSSLVWWHLSQPLAVVTIWLQAHCFLRASLMSRVHEHPAAASSSKRRQHGFICFWDMITSNYRKASSNRTSGDEDPQNRKNWPDFVCVQLLCSDLQLWANTAHCLSKRKSTVSPTPSTVRRWQTA